MLSLMIVRISMPMISIGGDGSRAFGAAAAGSDGWYPQGDSNP
jgi:hypothetical protein